jgi:single-stranded-DNA-specific exonuclease
MTGNALVEPQVQPQPKRWIFAPEITSPAREALGAFHPVLAQVLFNRGIADEAAARAFLSGRYDWPDDPYGILGVEAAADRIRRAIRAGERIAVYGDYDTDGVTATALLVLVLESLGADAIPYIPNRFDEGMASIPML